MTALSKTTSGFELIIGPLFNEGWTNNGISIIEKQCEKCPSEQLELHKLKKFVFAFGQIIVKHISVLACRNCYHELEVSLPKSKLKKVKKENNLDKFMSLSKAEQDEVLKGR